MKQLTTITVTIIFLAHISLSCTKEYSQNFNNENLKIGEMHNKLLVDFYNTNPNFKNSEYTIESVIDEMETIFDLNYPNLKNQFAPIDVKSFYINTNARSSDYNLINHIDQLGQQLVNDGAFNRDLFLFLKDVVIEKPSYEEMLDDLNIFKNDHLIELENDVHFKRSIEVLEEIALYSSSYWENNNFTTTNREVDYCEQQGYIADIATSALLFWNPIASIIGGAAASLITSENCQDGNH